MKQPTVLEFLGLDEKTHYVESDLETAIIDKMQKFLLEMGKGYLFEARQKRFTFDEYSYYVDLNSGTVNVKIDKENVINVDTLNGILEKIAREEWS